MAIHRIQRYLAVFSPKQEDLPFMEIKDSGLMIEPTLANLPERAMTNLLRDSFDLPVEEIFKKIDDLLPFAEHSIKIKLSLCMMKNLENDFIENLYFKSAGLQHLGDTLPAALSTYMTGNGAISGKMKNEFEVYISDIKSRRVKKSMQQNLNIIEQNLKLL
jgi:hypothetical protein